MIDCEAEMYYQLQKREMREIQSIDAQIKRLNIQRCECVEKVIELGRKLPMWYESERLKEGFKDTPAQQPEGITTSNKRTSGSPAGSTQTSSEASDVRIIVKHNVARRGD